MSNDEAYQVNLISAVPERYKCPLCKLLLRNAIQTFRGELACESCYKNARRSNPAVCPIDGEPIDDSHIFQDKHSRRAVLQLLCCRNNKDNGCQWEGDIQDTEDHIKEYTQKTKECPFKCQANIPSNEMYDQIKKFPKLETVTICPYSILGCKQKVNGKKSLEKHLQENVTIHAALAMSIVQTAKEENETLKHQLQNEWRLRTELQERVEEQINVYAPVKADMLRLQEKLWTIEKEFAEYRAQVDGKISNLKSEIEMAKQNSHGSLSKPVQDTMGLLDARYEDLQRKNRDIK